MAIKQVKRCIACNKKPVWYMGHVLHGKEHIIAGFCGKHYDAMRNNGLFGRWRKCMGKEDF